MVDVDAAAAPSVLVIVESATGNTRRAGEEMVAAFGARGWVGSVCNAKRVDLAALQAADLVVVGTWTDGLFIVGQRPGGGGRIATLPLLAGKPVATFVTFAINPGKTLAKLDALVESREGRVLGGMTIRRDDLIGGAHEFVDRVLAVFAPAASRATSA